MIDENSLHRFEECKKYLDLNQSSYGKYWSQAGKTFDISLDSKGFINLGIRNYFPELYEESKKSKKDIIDINHRSKKFNNEYSENKIEYLNINGIKYCNTYNTGNDTLANSKYYLDLLSTYCKNNIEYILEIGSGCGILSSLLHEKLSSKNILIDIPRVILCSISFVLTTFTDKKILLPNEVGEDINFEDFDFVFLLPEQKQLVKKNTIDLCINTQSFMEIDYREIEEYFNFIKDIVKNEKYFFCSNRLRKVNKFFDYPWRNLSHFKKIYIGRNEWFLKNHRHSTIIDFVLIKDKDNNFRYNNINLSERFVLPFAFTKEEFLFWFIRDFKRGISNILKMIIPKKYIFVIKKFLKLI